MNIKIFHLFIGLFFLLVVILITQASQIRKELITEDLAPQILETKLDTIWEIEISDRGDIYYTERAGRLNVIIQEDGYQTYRVPGVFETAEGGLLGLALHPKFKENGWIYLYITTMTDTENLINKVVRYEVDNGSLKERRVIVDEIPGADRHNGGRIKFGPDGLLYITTGDALNPEGSQDKNILSGKILRVRDDGTIPSDNPFANEVYSYGLRNSEGIAWDGEGRLWATDHGEQANDEVNLIKKGKNYGWPVITGDNSKAGLVNPSLISGTSNTWAPAGLAYHENMLYFGALRGKAIIIAKIEGSRLTDVHEEYKNVFGRIRAVFFNHSQLYIGTSNRDGRGDPSNLDDRIMIIKP